MRSTPVFLLVLAVGLTAAFTFPAAPPALTLDAIAARDNDAVVTVGTLTALAAKGYVTGKKATIQLSWTDTNTTVQRTIIQRRTTTDTIWKQLGYNFGKTTSFLDPFVSVGVKYIYRVRDSLPANALGTWSDTAYTTIPVHY